ncbi:DNA repair protein XRCC4 isoform 2-T3 [Synchiropus picturatus]
MATWVHEVSVSTGSSYFLRVDSGRPDLSLGFQLLLTDGRSAWRGQVSAESLRQEASEMEMQEESYLQDLLGALTQAQSCYRFSLTPSPPEDGETLTLTYEKVQEDISFQLGSVPLQSVSEPTEEVRQLLLHSLERRSSLQDQNQRLEQENQILRREHLRASAELTVCVSGKEAWEAALFQQFVEVLNTQKALTRVLQDSVENLKQDSSEDPSAPAGDDHLREVSSEDEAQDLQAASTSSAATDDILDELLSDLTDVAPSRKRRHHLRTSAAPPPKRTDNPTKTSTPSTPPLNPSEAAGWEIDDLFEDI